MKSIFSVFKKGLRKTATSVARTVEGIVSNVEKWDENTYEELETALLAADFGAETAFRMVDDIRDRYAQGLIKTSEDVNRVIADDIVETMRAVERPIKLQENAPTVIFLVGVNGSGKTTTAGKLAWMWKNDGKKVLMAACDTFRAAAVEQLKLWGTKTGCHVVAAKHGADPSAVLYDAVESSGARGADILLVDTAGRQHTKKGLMEELSKMTRVADKALPGAPHETWLVLDAGTGSNALRQAEEFAKSATLTGAVLTKLDGTGKGGMAVAIQNRQKLPVFFAGFGEGVDDLQPFDPEMFANAIFCADNGE